MELHNNSKEGDFSLDSKQKWETTMITKSQHNGSLMNDFLSLLRHFLLWMSMNFQFLNGHYHTPIICQITSTKCARWNWFLQLPDAVLWYLFYAIDTTFDMGDGAVAECKQASGTASSCSTLQLLCCSWFHFSFYKGRLICFSDGCLTSLPSRHWTVPNFLDLVLVLHPFASLLLMVSANLSKY